MYQFRQGSIAEAVQLNRLIPEFNGEKSLAFFEDRLSGKSYLILIAEYEGINVGFKVGYQLTEQHFYSWLGGVLPDYRGKGVASQLRVLQESWAREQGYDQISVKSSRQFPAMVKLVVSAGYRMTGSEKMNRWPYEKICFSKLLSI